VFDCRGILNPGRIEAFKTQHGRDKSVKDYLEQQTHMLNYLNSVFDLVDMTVEDYINRDFDSLMVSFRLHRRTTPKRICGRRIGEALRNKFKGKNRIKAYGAG